MLKTQEEVLSFEMHWSSITSKNTRIWLTLVMIWNKCNFSLLNTQCKYPLKFPISARNCSVWTGIIPRHEEPSLHESTVLLILNMIKLVNLFLSIAKEAPPNDKMNIVKLLATSRWLKEYHLWKFDNTKFMR